MAETYPVKVEDNPSYLYFPGDGKSVEYREGLYVGYRFYDAVGREPLFPFGYGLSYTDFSYEAINLDKTELSDMDTLKVTVKIKNIGKLEGKETVQLYVCPKDSPVPRPQKELKGFEKITLESEEEGEVVFSLGKRAFAYYDTDIKDWYVPDGEYEIAVGSSSRDIHLAKSVTLKSENRKRNAYTRNSTVFEIYGHREGKIQLDRIFQTIEDKGGMKRDFVLTLFKDMPIRSFHMIAGSLMNEENLTALLKKLQ